MNVSKYITKMFTDFSRRSCSNKESIASMSVLGNYGNIIVFFFVLSSLLQHINYDVEKVLITEKRKISPKTLTILRLLTSFF